MVIGVTMVKVVPGQEKTVADLIGQMRDLLARAVADADIRGILPVAREEVAVHFGLERIGYLAAAPEEELLP